ncbi:MAG: hypothetical protein KBA91_04490 [Candidatus Moranbacteria bacterium]|jgi:hypothetical protein|nr:hypothetical protein [Candidatus Moranbacteria bacterium]
MHDIFGRGEKKSEALPQRQFWQKFLFLSQKGFSGFALLFFGVSGVFPALPPIDTKELVASTDEAITTSLPIDHNQVCRWQRDFTFFNELLVVGEKKVPTEETPCVDESPVESAPVESARPEDRNLRVLISTMTDGYPLQVMAPAISEYDREVAALIVGIAKKESNWGKRVPVDTTGADCFNYWGFKGAGSRGVAMGHGCFGSPEEAVHAVGNRIAELVQKRQTSEPKNMIIWKCGSSCATHSPESVQKWIADVDLYYRQIVRN